MCVSSELLHELYRRVPFVKGPPLKSLCPIRGDVTRMPTLLQHSNAEVWKDPQIVAPYVHADYLEDAERTIVRLLKPEMSSFDMLDIAVGAGRTTGHFAPLVRSYVGIDLSPAMIDACITKYAHQLSRARFLVSDMSSMGDLADKSFSFVLISYNAISALDHDDRLRTIQEVHRVCTVGGKFCFSTFHLPSIYRPDGIFGLPYALRSLSLKHPKHSYWALQNWLYRRFVYNSASEYRRARRRPYVILNDGSHGFRLRHYYVQPEEQLRQLRAGFQDIRIFARDGSEVTRPDQYARTKSDWLFYLCTRKG